MQTSLAGIDLIKKHEKLRLVAYKPTPKDRWTIGYGTTAQAGVGIAPKAGMTITEVQAEKYLAAALDKFIKKIEPSITAPINENEFAAFVSLAYNIGPHAFIRSTALRKFNMGDKAGAANGILMFNKDNGVVVKGLQRRRAAEVKLFQTPVASTSSNWVSDLLKALAEIFKRK